MACARTVAVVVPSPATSEVLEATSLHHLRAHVLQRVLQLNFLGDGDAVLGDERRTKFLLDDDVAALGAKGDFHCVGENVHAAQNRLTGIFTVHNLLCHFLKSPIETFTAGAASPVICVLDPHG